MRKVAASEVATAIEATERPLPPQIQEALGELVGAAREGLLALSVGVGLGVVHELMELEVDEVVGPNVERRLVSAWAGVFALLIVGTGVAGLSGLARS